jgi:hypothetical protein
MSPDRMKHHKRWSNFWRMANFGDSTPAMKRRAPICRTKQADSAKLDP